MHGQRGATRGCDEEEVNSTIDNRRSPSSQTVLLHKNDPFDALVLSSQSASFLGPLRFNMRDEISRFPSELIRIPVDANRLSVARAREELEKIESAVEYSACDSKASFVKRESAGHEKIFFAPCLPASKQYHNDAREIVADRPLQSVAGLTAAAENQRFQASDSAANQSVCFGSPALLIQVPKPPPVERGSPLHSNNLLSVASPSIDVAIATPADKVKVSSMICSLNLVINIIRIFNCVFFFHIPTPVSGTDCDGWVSAAAAA